MGDYLHIAASWWSRSRVRSETAAMSHPVLDSLLTEHTLCTTPHTTRTSSAPDHYSHGIWWTLAQSLVPRAAAQHNGDSSPLANTLGARSSAQVLPQQRDASASRVATVPIPLVWGSLLSPFSAWMGLAPMCRWQFPRRGEMMSWGERWDYIIRSKGVGRVRSRESRQVHGHPNHQLVGAILDSPCGSLQRPADLGGGRWTCWPGPAIQGACGRARDVWLRPGPTSRRENTPRRAQVAECASWAERGDKWRWADMD
jgi:hypothetical protein